MGSPGWRDKGPPCFCPARKSSFASSRALGNTWDLISPTSFTKPPGSDNTSSPRSLAIEKASPLSPSITLLTNGPRSTSVFCLPDFEDFRLAPDFGVETADVGWVAWVAPDKSGKVANSSASSAAGSVAVVPTGSAGLLVSSNCCS